jgi:uncharacterized protein (DUF924 family)
MDAITLPPAAAEVLDFWFGDSDIARPEWFRKDTAFDDLSRQRFGGLIAQALAGAIDDWAATPEGALARIVVLDQFPRNVFRDTPRAFAGDRLALAAARALVDAGGDRLLPPRRRSFVYLPFEHAEDRAAQQTAVALFGALAAEQPDLAEALDWARRHQVVIERFGRFPHRNRVLGRVDTAEEAAFLLEPGSRF